MAKRLLLLCVPLVLALSACSGGGGSNEASGTPEPTATGTHHESPSQGGASCSPSGTELEIEAEGFKFDTDCLAAPDGQPFTIKFDNKDAGVPHNVDIMTSETGGEELFKGEIITGVTETTYHVGALDAGTYHFQCDVHTSTMNGTFVVA